MYVVSLKNQKEFDRVNRHGIKAHGGFFILIISSHIHETQTLSKNNATSSFLFGMKVSRRFSKKAVVRNKVKRRIRHLVRMIANDLKPIAENKALIIIPKIGFDKTNFAELHNDFNNVFIKTANKIHSTLLSSETLAL